MMKAKDVNISRIVGGCWMRSPGADVRHIGCGILLQRTHTFFAEMWLVRPAPPIKFFIFFGSVANAEHFPLDGYAQADIHCKTAVNQRFDSVRPAKVVLLACIYHKRFHTTFRAYRRSRPRPAPSALRMPARPRRLPRRATTAPACL